MLLIFITIIIIFIIFISMSSVDDTFEMRLSDENSLDYVTVDEKSDFFLSALLVSSDHQKWVYNRSNKTLTNKLYDLCMSSGEKNPDKCSSSDKNQQWEISGNKIVNVGNPSISWVYIPFDALIWRLPNGRGESVSTNGASHFVWAPNANDSKQQWIYTKSKNVINPISGLCMSSDGKVNPGVCSWDKNHQWDILGDKVINVGNPNVSWAYAEFALPPDPVDCLVSNWGTCENGKQTRDITRQSMHNGARCPVLEQSCLVKLNDMCNTASDCENSGTFPGQVGCGSSKKCKNLMPNYQGVGFAPEDCRGASAWDSVGTCTDTPTDCVLSDWTTCMNNTQTRKVLRNPISGGAECSTDLVRDCETVCIADGTWSAPNAKFNEIVSKECATGGSQIARCRSDGSWSIGECPEYKSSGWGVSSQINNTVPMLEANKQVNIADNYNGWGVSSPINNSMPVLEEKTYNSTAGNQVYIADNYNGWGVSSPINNSMPVLEEKTYNSTAGNQVNIADNYNGWGVSSPINNSMPVLEEKTYNSTAGNQVYIADNYNGWGVSSPINIGMVPENPSWSLFWSNMPDNEFNLGEFGANLLFSKSFVICRTCLDCDSKATTIYYKRLTPLKEGWSMYSNMIDTWSSKNNVINIDFKLFSTLDDLKNNVNEWQYCSYDDNGIGGFRDCGSMSGQWNSKVYSGRTVNYYVLNEQDVPGVQPTLPKLNVENIRLINGIQSWTIDANSVFLSPTK
jgi:hypothetical protein